MDYFKVTNIFNMFIPKAIDLNDNLQSITLKSSKLGQVSTINNSLSNEFMTFDNFTSMLTLKISQSYILEFIG